METSAHADNAISLMRAPGQPKETGGHIYGVIQVIVTNKCDLLKCSNCTQMLTHQKESFFMSVENFRRAVESLRDYPGIVGVFGGNPCVHPRFAELARVIQDVIPEKRRRGLWSNNVNGHGELCREVFGYFNLNVHTNPKHAAEMYETLPGVRVWGAERQSWHSPTLVAIKDVIHDEKRMWDTIAHCDVNHKWSGAITERKGELRAFFCEIAASFDNVWDEDTGLPVTPGWWHEPMQSFAGQAKRWCPGCGIPLKMKGHLDLDFTDDVSSSNLVVLNVKRKTQLHTSLDGEARTHEATDYQRLRAKSAH